MRNKVSLILIITVMLNIWIWPKDNKEDYINTEAIYPKEIIISIEGEVTFPGTYVFYENITLDEVLIYAGGLLDGADVDNINLNELLNKSKSFYFLKKNDENINEKELIKLNINKATFQDLIKIPNITEKRAANIIIYREKNGLFNSVDDLINVKYIGVSILEKISNYITV